MEINKCPISNTKESVEYLNLGNIPLVNNLSETKEESLLCRRFPLSIQIFPKSSLTCLKEIVEKDDLFLKYFYRSGINKPYLKHCEKMYEYLSRYIDFNSGDLVADIGGNDGSLLLEFKKENPHLCYINVDCSETFVDINQEQGIKYIKEYFDHKTILPYKAKLITSTNVFQHTEPIRSFVQGIERNLSSEGIWCLEFPYLLVTLMNDNYDQIYHEHIYYYRLKNIIDLLEQEGMKVINVSYHDMHTGTLRVLSVKKSSLRQPDNTVDSFLNMEKNITMEYCLRWGEKIHKKIEEFKFFILDLSKKGNTIAGFGAAAKGCVFLNTCEFDFNTIKFIIDDTVPKQGKFVPGTGIEVVNREILKTNQVDYIIILAHNFKEYIIESLKNEYNGKYIIMFPEIKVI